MLAALEEAKWRDIQFQLDSTNRGEQVVEQEDVNEKKQKEETRNLLSDNYVHRATKWASKLIRQVLVLRQPSVFWDDTCILNLFAKLNNFPIRFHYTDDLIDKSYSAFARYDGLVLFPYDIMARVKNLNS